MGSLADPGTAETIAQLELTSKNVPKDQAARQQLYEAARGLVAALEAPGDTIQRLVHLVKLRRAVHCRMGNPQLMLVRLQ